MAAATPLTIPALLDAAAARWPGAPCLAGPAGTATFAELHQRVAGLASGLAGLGVRQGDRVGVLLPSHPAYVETWLALARLGAVLVPVNTGFRAAEIGQLLDHAGVTALVTTDALHEQGVQAIRGRCPALRTLVTLEGGAPGAVPLRALRQASAPPPVPVAETDTAAILYTSGTTGLPKGCCLTHRHYVLGGRMIRDVLRASAEDRFLCVLPLFHVGGQIALVMAALASGAALVLLPGFSASTFWQEVGRWRPTVFHAVGTILAILDRLPPSSEEREHGLRVILSAGHPELVATLATRLGIPIVQNWGMTEGGMTATRLHGPNPPGSIGLPVGPNEIRLVDDDGHDVPPGAVGEIVMRGPLLVKEYWREPAATAEAMRGGWFHTGDLARRDAQGYLYFVDRKKDMVRRGGENVSSQEVEHVLRSHPCVEEAAVVPVPDPVWGEEVKAFVVLRPGQSAATAPADALRAFCAERLAAFKVPRDIEYRTDLPRTASHRIRKALLRKETQP